MSDVKKLKSNGEILSLIKHVLREDVELKNVDKEKKYLNHHIKGKGTSAEIMADLKEKLKTVKKRKNGVLCLAFLLSHSHEQEDKIRSRRKEWNTANLDWLKKTYGEENLLLVASNNDEKTGHIHALVIPKVKKMVKGKELDRLDAFTVLGDRTKMRQMHTSYAEAMKPFGLVRGEEGSMARKLSLPEMYTNKKEERDYQERVQLHTRVRLLEKEVHAYKRKLKVAAEVIKEHGLQEEINSLIKKQIEEEKGIEVANS